MKVRNAVLCLSCTLLVHSAFAQSSVTLYGRLGEDVNYTHISGSKGTASKGAASMDDDASQWGLRIQEDLGSGSKVISVLENGFSLNNGAFQKSGYEFNKQAYIGISNTRYGLLSLGQQYAPEFYVSTQVDPFGRFTNGSMIALFQALPTNSRGFYSGIPNSVQYTSPKIEGIQAKLSYSLSNGGTTAASNIGEAQGASLTYANDKLYLAASYDNERIASTTAGLSSMSNSSYQVAATYQLPYVKVHGYYFHNDQRGKPGAYGYMLGLSSLITPSNEVMFSVSKRSSPTSQSGAKMAALGYNHFLSKRTVVYVSAAYLENDRNASYSLWPSLSSYTVTTGAHAVSVMAGIRHYF